MSIMRRRSLHSIRRQPSPKEADFEDAAFSDEGSDDDIDNDMEETDVFGQSEPIGEVQTSRAASRHGTFLTRRRRSDGDDVSAAALANTTTSSSPVMYQPNTSTTPKNTTENNGTNNNTNSGRRQPMRAIGRRIFGRKTTSDSNNGPVINTTSAHGRSSRTLGSMSEAREGSRQARSTSLTPPVERRLGGPRDRSETDPAHIPGKIITSYGSDPSLFPGNGTGGVGVLDDQRAATPRYESMTVRYGDYLRVYAHSAYTKKGGYVGSERRPMRARNTAAGKGELFVIPPTNNQFVECCFKVVDPSAKKVEGEDLLFGDEIHFVDDRGMVWNNKDGRFHGRLGPCTFGNGGMMHLILTKHQDGSDYPAVISRSPSANLGKKFASNGSQEEDVGVPVRYGDQCSIVGKKMRPHREGVVRGNITHFTRGRKGECGGYLRSDGKGLPVTFTIHHAPACVTFVTFTTGCSDGQLSGRVSEGHTHYKVPWNHELQFELPPPQLVNNTIPTHNHTITPPSIAYRVLGSPPPPSTKPGTFMPLGLGLGQTTGQSTPFNSNSSSGAAVNYRTNIHMHSSSSGNLLVSGGFSDSNRDVPAIIRVGLSTGGEVALRRSDIKNFTGKRIWYEASELDQPMCVLISIKKLAGKQEAIEETKSGKLRQMRPLLGVILLAAAARVLLKRASGMMGGDVGAAGMHSLLLELCVEAILSLLLLAVGAKRWINCSEALLPRPKSLTTVIDPAQLEQYSMKLIKCMSGRVDEMPIEVATGDEDNEPELEVPETFLLAECGDAEKALARYKDTLRWRKEMKADEALETPHTTFPVCKKYYPSCFHGTDSEGSIVYYEKMGGIDVKAMQAAGVDSKTLLWHYMYQMEYLWTKIAPKDEDRTTIVLDMAGVNMKEAIGGEVIGFVKAAVAMMTTHYPARSNYIFIINVPQWFAYVFALIKGFLNEGTKKKIRPHVASTFLKELTKIVPLDQIPAEYGGTSEYPMFQSPWEIEMAEHVKSKLGKPASPRNRPMQT